MGLTRPASWEPMVIANTSHLLQTIPCSAEVQNLLKIYVCINILSVVIVRTNDSGVNSSVTIFEVCTD